MLNSLTLMNSCINAIDTGICIIDQQGIMQMVNTAMASLCERKAGTLEGKLYKEILPKDKESAALIEALIQGKQDRLTECKVWWEMPERYKYIKGYAINEESPELGTSRILFLSDISDEAEQKNQLQYQASVLSSVQDSVIVTDREGIITYWNEAATELFGYTKEEMLGAHINSFNPRFDPKAFIANAQNHKEYYRRTDWEYTRPDGREVWADVKISLLYDESVTEFKGFIGVSKDITERKETEHKIQYLNAFNGLLLEISADLINLSYHNLGERIVKALGDVTKFTGFDRALMYLFNEDNSESYLQYEYCIEGIPPFSPETHMYPATSFSWWMEKILRLEAVEVPDVQGLPVEAENTKQEMEANGVRSMITVPIAYQQEVLGFVGFVSMTKNKNWDQAAISLLKLLGAIFANSLYRARTFEKLEESRNQYKLLADNISDMVTKHSADLLTNFVTPSCKEMLGYQHEELLDKSFVTWVHPEERPTVEQKCREALAGKPMRFVTRLRKKDGSYLWTETNAKVLEDEEGKELIAVTRDIDLQKQIEIEKDVLFQETHALNEELTASEEELRQTLDKTVELNDKLIRSEQKFKGLTEKSFDGIVVYGPDASIKYISPSATHILGYDQEDIPKMTGRDFIHPEDLPWADEQMFTLMQQPNHRITFEVRSIRKDGEVVWVESTFTNLLEDPAIQGLVGNFREVTERKKSAMRLEEIRTSLNMAQRVAKVGSWELELATMKSYLSDEFYNILGLEQEKHLVSLSNIIEYVHPEDRERLQALSGQVMQGQKVSDLEYRIIDNRGQLKYIRAHSRPLVDKQGKIVKILGTIQDVTKEMELERLLEETSRLAKVGGWEVNMVTNELIWTKETYAIHEVSLEQALNVEGITQFCHPDDWPVIQEAIDKIVRDGGKYDLELRIITAKGNLKWIRTTGSAVDKTNDKVTRIRGSIQDITERKQKEDEVKKYSERLTLATEFAQIGVWDLDIQHNILYWDRQTCGIFGIKEDQHQGTLEGLRILLHPADQRKIPELEKLKAWKSENMDVQFRIIRPDTKELRYMKSSAKVLFDKRQRAIRMVGVHWDITSLRENEDHLRKNNEELRKTNAELDHFVYSTSHNLRAPLTSVMGIVDVLRESNTEEERKKFIDLIQKSIYKLDETIQEINDYSKNARVEVQKEPIDLKQMIENTAESLSYMDNARKMKMEVSLSEDLEFYSDKGRLKIIFNNLLSNAVKYVNPMQENPFVSVVVEKKANDILIQVKDNGIGIKEEYQNKVFDMFFRATNKSSGSGLGLYIVREAVEKLGGNISVTSAPGKGTDFNIRLPNQK